ncbi:response regulator [Pseudomonas sp. EA_65y_Pfl1_P113]|uniref:response regulator n=1 Tax=Pseudomonas sp. EA_65y_Pfl1_P113 TaxID=3088692 RepID=UPI0030D74FE0
MISGWRNSLVLRITCLLALVLSLSWGGAAGLSAWRTYEQLQSEELDNLSQRLRLLTSVNDDDFRDAEEGVRRLVLLWNNGDAKKLDSTITQRSNMSWVLDPTVVEDKHLVQASLLAHAAAAAEAFGVAGHSMIVDAFFYFPGAGAAFSTEPDIPHAFSAARAKYLRELFARLSNSGPALIWDGPHYEKSINRQILSIIAVSRDAQGKPLLIAGYELKLDERLTRIEKLLDSHASLLLDRDGRRVADLSQHSLDDISEATLNKLITGLDPAADFPQVSIVNRVPAVIAHLSQPDWYLVSLYPQDRLRTEALRLILGEIPFAVIGFVLLALGLLLVLRRQLALPLAGFARSIQLTATGTDLSLRLPVAREDELGLFAASYNELLDAIQTQQAGLENLVSERTHELRTAREAADQANLLKGQFLANMSHEIRTPMNAVIGMNHLLADTALNAQQQHFVLVIRENSEALLALINDILDFSKVESGSLSFESIEFDLIEVLEEVVELLASRAAEKGLRMICQIASNVPTHVLGDPWRLRQVLLNLLSNAVKFTTSGYIRLVAWRSDGQLLGFQVIDTGIGIAEQAQEAVFDAFRQADASTTRHFGGTGLGLSISRRLAQLMGGKIQLQSEVGVGSTFSLFLPLPDCPTPQADDSRLWGLRILVVDEHSEEREALIGILGQWRIFCQGSSSAQDALQLMRQRAQQDARFDLVLVNYRLPMIDGLAFAEQCRVDVSLTGARLILMVALGESVPSHDDLRRHGLAACVTRPLRRQQLYRTLCEVQSGATPAVQDVPSPLSSLDCHAYSLDVLVVDDIATNRQITKLLLERFGHRVSLASDGVEALEILASRVFDVVLMDGQMPRLDGMETIRRLRSGRIEVLNDEVWVIALTANAMSGDRERFLEAGADDYLAKPVLPAQLFSAISRVITLQLKRGMDMRESTAQEPAVELVSEDCLATLRAPRLQRLFNEDCKRLLACLEEAVAATEYIEAARTAHSLKGSAGQFGELELEALADTVEVAALNSDYPALLGALKQLKVYQNLRLNYQIL